MPAMTLKAVTRRANNWLVLTGPKELVRAATDREIRATLAQMTRVQHVNTDILRAELKDRGTESPSPRPRWPLTVINLMFLERGGMGQQFKDYCTLNGVEVREQYDRHSTPENGLTTDLWTFELRYKDDERVARVGVIRAGNRDWLEAFLRGVAQQQGVATTFMAYAEAVTDTGEPGVFPSLRGHMHLFEFEITDV